MDPVLGSVIGLALAALIGGCFAVYQTQRVEKAKEQASANTMVMEATKAAVEGLDRLSEQQRAELDRKDRAIKEQSAEIARLLKQHRLDRIEIEFCRTNHPPVEGDL